MNEIATKRDLDQERRATGLKIEGNSCQQLQILLGMYPCKSTPASAGRIQCLL